MNSDDFPIRTTWEQFFRRLETAGVTVRHVGQEQVMRFYIQHLTEEMNLTQQFLNESETIREQRNSTT